MSKKYSYNTPPNSQFRGLIGKRLKAIRKAQGKEIKEVCKGCKMQVETLAKIEAGKSNFRLLTINRLCRYYGIKRVEIMLPGSGKAQDGPHKR